MKFFFKRFFLISLFVFQFVVSYAADRSQDESTGMQQGGKIFVVIGVIAIIWLGYGVFLFTIERRLSRVEKFLKTKFKNDTF